MRREQIDLSYKDRTNDIISNNYQPWQLAYNNNREFASILTNRLVSITEDLISEVEYVENMFFPDMMDINEEWIVYEVDGINQAGNLLLSGNTLSSKLTQVSNMDEFIAGSYDHFDIISEIPTGFNISHACTINNNIMFLVDNYVYAYTPTTGNIISTMVYSVLSGETTLYVNKDDMDFPFQDEMENIQVFDKDNNIISHTYIDHSMCNSDYIEMNDMDSNGVINTKERSMLYKYKNKSSSDYTPEEWDNIKWMDYDRDGTIGTSDYTYLTSMIPALRGDIKSAISLPSTTLGVYTVVYETKIPRSELVISDNNNYKIFYNTDEISIKYKNIIYDDKTKILYGISKDDGLIYANRLDDSYSIIATSRLFLNTGLEKHTILDLGLHSGYIFVLTKYNNKYYIFYEDTRKEFLEYISRKAYLDTIDDLDITNILIDKSGYFYFHNTTTLFKVKAHRNKFIEMNDTVYFNIDHTITDLSGEPKILLPWNIFNSFDSFAFSFGIDRPAGCDNIKMKELIYDFWEHPHDNTAIGINYGIKRELGFVNSANAFDVAKYVIPANIDTTGDIYINEKLMIKTMGQNIVILSGEPGSFVLSGDNLLIPDQLYYDTNTNIDLTADFIDGNNEVQNLSYNIILTNKYTFPEIEVYSLGDPQYALSDKCIYSSLEIKDKIIEMEASDPFIYKNIKTDMYPLNAARISSIPMSPTTYGVEIDSSNSGIIEI